MSINAVKGKSFSFNHDHRMQIASRCQKKLFCHTSLQQKIGLPPQYASTKAIHKIVVNHLPVVSSPPFLTPLAISSSITPDPVDALTSSFSFTYFCTRGDAEGDQILNDMEQNQCGLLFLLTIAESKEEKKTLRKKLSDLHEYKMMLLSQREVGLKVSTTASFSGLGGVLARSTNLPNEIRRLVVNYCDLEEPWLSQADLSCMIESENSLTRKKIDDYRATGKIGKLEIFPFCKSLCHLSLNEIIFSTDQELQNILKSIPEGRLLSLTHLELPCHDDLTDAGLAFVAANIPNLTHLNVECCPEITEKGLSLFVNLTHLNIGSCTLTEEGFSFLATKLLNLVDLKACHCMDLTDLGISSFATSCKKLTHLDVTGCKKITEKGIFPFAASCPNLTHLNVSFCQMITGEGVSAFDVIWPSLTYLDISYSNQLLKDRAISSLYNSCPKLAQFYLKGYNPTEKELFLLTNLTHLGLGQHRITKAQADLLATCYPKLVHLDLSGYFDATSTDIASLTAKRSQLTLKEPQLIDGSKCEEEKN